jgi:nucleosome binding factor SPN SPT16 subunit
LLADTIKVAAGKAILLTEGVKAPKEALFFLTQDEKPAPKPKKEAPVKPIANGSPAKNKMAGGKMLRTKTRSAQQDVSQTTMSRIAEHQQELFENRQRDGVAKYSEEGDGNGKNEGKQWKRFQSYKGEGGLPAEAESLRVCSPSVHS